jgi:hypothetical protein
MGNDSGKDEGKQIMAVRTRKRGNRRIYVQIDIN